MLCKAVSLIFWFSALDMFGMTLKWQLGFVGDKVIISIYGEPGVFFSLTNNKNSQSCWCWVSRKKATQKVSFFYLFHNKNIVCLTLFKPTIPGPVLYLTKKGTHFQKW